MLYIFGLVLFSTIAWLIYYLRHDNREEGEAEASNKAIKDMLDDAYLVKTARDLLNAQRDAAAGKLLRDKYTRK